MVEAPHPHTELPVDQRDPLAPLPQRHVESVGLGEGELSWWQDHRLLPFCGAVLAALMLHASVVACMAAAGFFTEKPSEPDTLPTIEVVILGSVGDGYRAGKIGHKEGTSEKPNLRSSAPTPVPSQPQASKPAASKPTPKLPPPVVPPATQPQPTQPKPVVKPTVPTPKLVPTQPQPKPQPTKPIEKELVAQKAPVEKKLLPPPPPPKKEEPKPVPSRPVVEPPRATPPATPSPTRAAALPSQARPEETAPAPPTSAKAASGDTSGESSRGDADYNGSGRRRGTRGSGGEGDGVHPPSGFYNPQPPYPAAALAAGRQGSVILWLKIGTDGYVEWVKVHQSSGDPEMDGSALATVRNWRFNPARNRKTGEPVTSEHLKTIDFVIR